MAAINTQGCHEALVQQLQQKIVELQNECASLCTQQAQLRSEYEQLQKSQARYRQVFENAPISICFVAADGRPTQANQAFERMYGLTIEQLAEQDFNIFTDRKLSENSTLSYIERAFAGETVIEPPRNQYDASRIENGNRICYGQGHYFPIWDEGTVQEIVEIYPSFDAWNQAKYILVQAELDRAAEIAKANDALQAEVAERLRVEQVSHGQTEVLVKTLTVLAKEPVLDNFLGYVLQAIAQQLGEESGGIWLLNEEHAATVLHINYEDRKIQHATEISRPGTVLNPSNKWDAVYLNLLQQQKILVHDERDFAATAYDSGRASFAKRGIKTVLYVSLFFGDSFLGFITVRSRQQRNYKSEEIELACALAHQATLAILLIRLMEQTRETAVLTERNRLACEIHDTLAQGLTGIIVQLQAAEDIQIQNPLDRSAHIQAARLLAKDCLAEARRSVWALRPQILENNTLCEALAHLVNQMTANTGIIVRCDFEQTDCSLSPTIEDNLLRIAQEALTNILKHAHADTIWVELAVEATQIRLRLQDNGQGFVPEFVKNGFGLMSMHERAQIVKAHLTLTSQPGEGTSVIVIVPLNESKIRRQP